MAGTIVAFALCAFRTLMLDSSPLPSPEMEYVPGPEAFFAFMLAYLLLVLLILLVLPEEQFKPIIELAFRLKPKSKESGL